MGLRSLAVSQHFRHIMLMMMTMMRSMWMPKSEYPSYYNYYCAVIVLSYFLLAVYFWIYKNWLWWSFVFCLYSLSFQVQCSYNRGVKRILQTKRLIGRWFECLHTTDHLSDSAVLAWTCTSVVIKSCLWGLCYFTLPWIPLTWPHSVTNFPLMTGLTSSVLSCRAVSLVLLVLLVVGSVLFSSWLYHPHIIVEEFWPCFLFSVALVDWSLCGYLCAQVSKSRHVRSGWGLDFDWVVSTTLFFFSCSVVDAWDHYPVASLHYFVVHGCKVPRCCGC